MIDRNLILKNAPSNIGEQIHVNHKDCPAGEDTKRRLYIKRTDRGVVAYCHHCTEHGFASEISSSRLSTWVSDKRFIVPPTIKNIKPPELAGHTSWEATKWLADHYVTNTTSSYFDSIKGNIHTVSLRICDRSGETVGYQIRNLIEQPKYVTYYLDPKDKGSPAWFYAGSTKLVITEDYLSAHRVFQDTRCDAVALLGTNLTDKALFAIKEEEYTVIYIWLDPDAAGIEGAAKVCKKLSYYLKEGALLIVLGPDREPKQYTPPELAKELS